MSASVTSRHQHPLSMLCSSAFREFQTSAILSPVGSEYAMVQSVCKYQMTNPRNFIAVYIQFIRLYVAHVGVKYARYLCKINCDWKRTPCSNF